MTKNLKEAYVFWRLEEGLEEAKFDPKTLQPGTSDEELTAKVAYVQDQIKLLSLGEGSSRRVFALDSKRALKLATNQKGLAQNKAEIQLSGDSAMNGITARVFAFSPDGAWILSELVRPVNKDEFRQLARISFLLFQEFMYDLEKYGFAKTMERVRKEWEADYVKQSFPEVNQGVDKLVRNSFLGKAAEGIDNAQLKLLQRDLVKLDHWGKTPDQRVVLLDYGLTKGVEDQHYS